MLSEDEREALSRRVQERIDQDKPGTTGSVVPYNEFWYERGTLNNRTALIVDPEDGRIPPLTPEGQKRWDDQVAYRREHPADSWLDRSSVRPLHLARHARHDAARLLQPQLPDRPDQGLRGDPRRDGPRRAHHPARRPAARQPERSAVAGRLARPLRRQHAGHRNHQLQRQGGRARRRWGFGGNITMVERFTRIDKDHMDYQFTIDDPKTFTRPWTVNTPMIAIKGPIFEYACHEGNHALPGILGGARADERKAAARRVTSRRESAPGGQRTAEPQSSQKPCWFSAGSASSAVVRMALRLLAARRDLPRSAFGPPFVRRGIRCVEAGHARRHVARLEWTNPHAWLYLDVAAKTEKPAVGAGALAPNALTRRGFVPTCAARNEDCP